MVKKCLQCSHEFNAERKKTKFCSQSCFAMSNKGKTRNVTWGAALSKALKGRKMTPEWRKKMSDSAKGKIKSPEHCKAISESKKGKPNPLRAGENSNWWKGGVTPEYKKRITSTRWERLRREIIKRDGGRCQMCGVFPARIEVHHIIPWRISKDDSPENLMTICPPCHRRLDNR